MLTYTDAKPAREFAAWLSDKRRSKNIVARAFAAMIWLPHAKYAEVELGIVSWLKREQEKLIPLALQLGSTERSEFRAKLKAARAAKQISFSELFTRDSLRPVRACHHSGEQLKREDEEKILDAVFAPLV